MSLHDSSIAGQPEELNKDNRATGGVELVERFCSFMGLQNLN